ncbi:MAG TPA: hypothetical protein PLH23_04920 [Hyphomonadaceae bacterium]|nr:hypothetical protein [Hyphomonadaceae bacterium]HPI47588.1 hypothetical protein [Hyphomonadaceae bacterium]
MTSPSILPVLAAALVLISACGNKVAEKPVEPVAAPVAAAPPPPATPAEVLAALDPAGACVLFGKALSSKEKEVDAAGCTTTAGPSEVTFATADGATKLVAAMAKPGETIATSAANTSPLATEDKAHGGFTNIGMVFIGQAPAAGLCAQVEYFAPDGGSNSLYVWRIGEPVRVPFNLNKHETKIIKTYFAEPVIAGGKSGAFAITRREPGTVLKGVTFLDCAQVPPPEAQ